MNMDEYMREQPHYWIGRLSMAIKLFVDGASNMDDLKSTLKDYEDSKPYLFGEVEKLEREERALKDKECGR